MSGPETTIEPLDAGPASCYPEFAKAMMRQIAFRFEKGVTEAEYARGLRLGEGEAL